jgi:hypothetical protein
LVSAGGLDDDEGRTNSGELLNQATVAIRIVRDGPLLTGGTDMHIELMLRDVDSYKHRAAP